MLSMLSGSDKIVGTKQVTRAVAAGTVKTVYLATDADVFVTRKVRDLCNEKNVDVIDVPSMKALGEACGVEVKAAVAAIKK
jgi:large subunit ribosomal protein L7A